MSRIAYTLNEILEKFKKTHNDKYDYSLVEYKTVDDTVKIICKRHGIFKITPSTHIIGYGCRKCKIEDNFLKKANKLYNNKFDYIKIKFTRMSDKIEIICPIHKSFWRTPNYHLRGTGCKKCNHIKKIKN